MTSLDERIAALFRKGTPIFGDADQPSPVDHPITDEAASEAVVSEPAGEEINAAPVDDKPTLASQETVAAQNTLPMGGIGFRHGDPSPLGATRYQSQANETNARQSK